MTVDLNVLCHDGDRLIHKAASAADYHLIISLVERGVLDSLRTENGEGKTAWELARQSGMEGHKIGISCDQLKKGHLISCWFLSFMIYY